MTLGSADCDSLSRLLTPVDMTHGVTVLSISASAAVKHIPYCLLKLPFPNFRFQVVISLPELLVS